MDVGERPSEVGGAVRGLVCGFGQVAREGHNPEGRRRAAVATPAVRDADAVAELFLDARRSAFPKVKVLHSVAETSAWMRDVVFPRRSIRIAELASEIVGFAARDGAWLEHLYVKVGWTGRGIGRRLL